MRFPLLLWVILFGVSGSVLRGEDVPDDAKRQATEMKKLEIFVGKWKLKEVIEPSPFGPGGTGEYSLETRLVHDGFYLEERGKGTFKESGQDKSKGERYSMTQMHYYDTAVGTFRSMVFGNGGGTPSPRDEMLVGRTRSSEWTTDLKGKSIKMKIACTVAADGKSWLWHRHYSEDGETWKLSQTVTAKKIGDVR